MSEPLHARSVGGTRAWHRPDTVAGDRDELAAMLAGSAADEGILGYEQVTTEQAAGFCAGLEHKLATGSGHVLLGSDDLGAFGMCVVDTTSMPNCKHIAEVSKAYLDPRVRHTSAVTELVAVVCRLARKLGIEVLRIDVREDSPAHRVWRRFGFTTYGVLPDYCRFGGVSYRGHYMSHSVTRLGDFAEERLHAAGVALAGEIFPGKTVKFERRTKDVAGT